MTYQPWPDQSPDAMEQALLARWKEERLFQRTLEAARGGPPFVFFEGPPTANGRPGIHHVFARTIKDLICRFQALQGRSVTRIAGWDTHGLPVEIEVEKQLGITGKTDIGDHPGAKVSVAEFNRLCRESVWKYKADWEALSDRVAYWLEYDRPYITYSNEYIETVWWLLARLHEKGLLVKGHKVLPYCPRCGTTLSSHELSLGYDKVRDKSIYVAFPLEDGSGRELVVWTTTPWTLPSNVAVAVHPDLDYVTVSAKLLGGPTVGFPPRRQLIMAKSRVGALFSAGRLPTLSGAPVPEPDEEFKGKDLVGLRYRRPLDVVPLGPDQNHAVVVPGQFVTAEDGSGMVHLAPAFGADDYAAGKEHGLAFVNPVAGDGTFRGTTWPEIEGKLVTADETNEAIIRKLKADGRWLLTEPYDHDYPFCWRCDSKLIYYAKDSWFVRTSAVKDKLVAYNRTVQWHPPEIGSGRFGEWLENNVDWALSRDRYWGTPLPVWSCDQEATHREVIGSYARLAERWGRALPADFDPHKPHIDGYTWACACGGTMRRATEVIDTWFDSGSMPYAQWHYPFEHEAEFKAHFPADYICEGVDQTRGWFYSLLAIATTAFDGPAYRHVIVNELVLDAEGQKMSKSRGNVVNPWELLSEFGADQVRLYLLGSSQVWLPKRFDRRQIPETAGGFVNTLKHTYEFFRHYARRGMAAPPRGERADADRWILSRLDGAVEAVTAAWAAYEPTAGVRAIMDFVVDELSNWYVRTNRERFWAPDREADTAAVATLRECLEGVSRLLAPAAPFVSDWIHREVASGSVHLSAWPRVSAQRDLALEAAMAAVRRLASLARAARETGKLRVRQPLARMAVAVPQGVRGPAFDRLLGLLKDEVNVNEIQVAESDASLVRLKGKANFRALGKRYGKETPAAAAAVGRLSADQLRTLEAGGEVALDVDGRQYVYLSEDVVVGREVATDWLVASDGPYVAALDPALDGALRAEGLAREVVHHVQQVRRKAGFDFTDRIELGLSGAAAVVEAARAHQSFIQAETLARRLALGGEVTGADAIQQVEIEGQQVTISVRRLKGGA
jgi:isoleucyl-tRNA synthetase